MDEEDLADLDDAFGSRPAWTTTDYEAEALAPDLWAEARAGATAELASFVERLVEDYELWAEIPPCWAEHAAMRLELGTLYAGFQAVGLARAEGIPAWAAAAATFDENRRRALEDLARSPGGRCAARGHHRPPLTWDRASSLERRRQLRREGRGATTPVAETLPPEDEAALFAP